MSTLVIKDKELLRLSVAMFFAVLATSFILGLTAHPLFWALGFPSFLILTIHSGVELNFTKLKYRKFKSFLGQRTGSWKPYNSEHRLVLLTKRGSKTLIQLVWLPDNTDS